MEENNNQRQGRRERIYHEIYRHANRELYHRHFREKKIRVFAKWSLNFENIVSLVRKIQILSYESLAGTWP